MLEYAYKRVDKQKLADVLNRPSMKEDTLKGLKGGLGTMDLALKCSIKTVPLLRWYGGIEQAEAPDKWNPGHRRDPEFAYQQSEAKRVFVFVNNELT